MPRRERVGLALLVAWLCAASARALLGPSAGGASPRARRTAAAAASADPSSSSSSVAAVGPAVEASAVCEYHVLKIPASQPGDGPRQAVSVEDLTPALEALLRTSGLRRGVATVQSRHTTTAIAVNERESRLFRDVAESLLRLVPPDERSASAARQAGVRYAHNDLNQRPESAAEADRCRANGWDIDDPATLAAWRAQEPVNAHAHLLSMLLGSSESLPVAEGRLAIGEWQSVLLVDLDGPRDRTVGVQLMGYRD